MALPSFAAPLSDEKVQSMVKDFEKASFDCGCPIYKASKLNPPKGEFTEKDEPAKTDVSVKRVEYSTPERTKFLNKLMELDFSLDISNDFANELKKTCNTEDCASSNIGGSSSSMNLKPTDLNYKGFIIHNVAAEDKELFKKELMAMEKVFEDVSDLDYDKAMDRLKSKEETKDYAIFIELMKDSIEELLESYFEEAVILKGSKDALEKTNGAKVDGAKVDGAIARDEVADKKDAFAVNFIVSGEKVLTAILDAKFNGDYGVQAMVYPKYAIEEKDMKDMIYSTRMMNKRRKNSKDFVNPWNELFEMEEDVPVKDLESILHSDFSKKKGFDMHQTGKRKYFDFVSKDVEKKYNEILSSVEKSFNEVESNEVVHWNYGTIYRKSGDNLVKTDEKALVQSFVLRVKNKDEDNFRNHHALVVLKFDKENPKRVADVAVY